MSTSLNPPGSFCWFELATSDQNAAKKFYSSLFGWAVNDSPMGPDEVYSQFQINGKNVAAAYTMQKAQRDMGVPPNWLVYIASNDVDATTARAKKLGATVHAEPFDVMDFGRMSVIQDPTGATFAVWQGKTHIGVQLPKGRNMAVWCDLSTSDQAKAGKFYSQLFGWKMVGDMKMTPAKTGDYFHIVNGKDMIGGVQPAQHRDPNTPPHWLIYFDVANADAINEKATSMGGRVIMPTMQMGEARKFAVLSDAQGAVFATTQELGGPEPESDKVKPAGKAKAKARPVATAKAKSAKAKAKPAAAKSKAKAKPAAKKSSSKKASPTKKAKPAKKKSKKRR